MLKSNFSVLCIILTLCSGVFFAVSCRAEKVDAVQAIDAEEVLPEPGALMLNTGGGQDLIFVSYLDPRLREGVEAFFRDLTGSSEIAIVVLSNAVAFNIPPALAFALCWEESGFNPRAINRNKNNTMDRGLFQLNSASFPNVEAEEFYDPNLNARYGLAHLRWCLNTAGTEVAGLAMYNAGTARVSSSGTPKNTLDYISRILKRQRKIEELFMTEYSRIAKVESSGAGEKGKLLFRLSLLTPLGGH